jgi:hypothetical protein
MCNLDHTLHEGCEQRTCTKYGVVVDVEDLPLHKAWQTAATLNSHPRPAFIIDFESSSLLQHSSIRSSSSHVRRARTDEQAHVKELCHDHDVSLI